MVGPHRRSVLKGAALAGIAAGGLPRLAHADTYPTRTVRIIVPPAPASGVDIMARKLAEPLAQRLGQPVIVDNKPGAGGVIGTGEMVRSPKDGHTLAMVASTHVINPGFIKTIPFDTLADITPITVVGSVAMALVCHPSVPAKSVADIIAMAKQKPGEVDYGSSGTGSVTHLAGVMFTREAGIDMKHVPYRGTGPLLNDIIAGHVKIGFLAVQVVGPYVEAGSMKVLAVSTPTRDPRLPDTPSFAEAGLSNYSLDSWVAVIGPKDLPVPIVDRLYRELKAIAETDRMKAEFVTQATRPIMSDPASAKAFFASEYDKHQKLVAASGAKPE